MLFFVCFFFFQAEDGIRDLTVTGVQTCALPIAVLVTRPTSPVGDVRQFVQWARSAPAPLNYGSAGNGNIRSEEHTSELQSQSNIVCRLLLEKKKKKTKHATADRDHSSHRQADV